MPRQIIRHTAQISTLKCFLINNLLFYLNADIESINALITIRIFAYIPAMHRNGYFHIAGIDNTILKERAVWKTLIRSEDAVIFEMLEHLCVPPSCLIK
jgi:hypothetical protein